MRWLWVLALVPALLGAAASVWLNAGNRSPLFHVTVDLGTVLLFLGILLSTAIGVVLICQTLIERARLESTHQANEDRRRFLRRLDHELKNPLTAILAGLANLSTVKSSSEHQPALDSVTAQVQRLRRLGENVAIGGSVPREVSLMFVVLSRLLARTWTAV